MHPLAGQPTPGPRLGLAVGMEVHGPWAGSVLSPTAAISLSTRLTPRIHVQGVLAGSGRIQSGEETDDVTFCPSTGCVLTETDPGATLGAAVELVIFDQPRDYGGYVLGGVGLVRYSGRGVGAPVRGQLGAGFGGVLGRDDSQVFVEVRLHYVLNAGPYPRWSAPVRLGWRMRI